MADTTRQVIRLLSSGPLPEEAYEAGFDCGVRGPIDGGAVMSNCHFSFFSRPELTREWERGKRDGEKFLGEDADG